MSDAVRENVAGVRALLVPFVVLASLGAIQLYLFPNDTDRFFAWTLRPSLSAMFMGAGYAAGVLLTILSYRRRAWAVTRTATLTIFVFTLFMLVATFLHIDKMHLGADVLTARLAAWLWVLVYVTVTPALLVIIVVQGRQPGVDPPRSRPLPRGLRAVLGVTGVALLTVGLVMFASPTSAAEFWPWEVTPLAARALASWLVAIGWAGLQAVYENDAERTRPAAATFTVIGALWILAASPASAVDGQDSLHLRFELLELGVCGGEVGNDVARRGTLEEGVFGNLHPVTHYLVDRRVGGGEEVGIRRAQKTQRRVAYRPVRRLPEIGGGGDPGLRRLPHRLPDRHVRPVGRAARGDRPGDEERKSHDAKA